MVKIKYYITSILKFFRRTINLAGIDVHFLQKEEDFDSIAHNFKENNDRFFKDPKSQENLYHPEVLKFYKDVTEKIKANNISLDNKSIADVGCGNGNLLVNLNKAFSPAHIYGFDFSTSAINQSKEKIPNGHFSEHDIYNPLPQKFDMIFCTEVIEHLLHPEIALKNLVEGMNDKGSLFITVPNGRLDTYKGHINFWSVESWKMFIQKNIPADLTFESGEFNKKIIYALIRKK